VYDVTNKREMYGPGAGYNVFAGKDASRGLGMSSLDPKDAVSDYSTLNEAQMKTLDQWDSFFAKVSRGRGASVECYGCGGAVGRRRASGGEAWLEKEAGGEKRKAPLVAWIGQLD
jgi:hypothetical protein